MPVPVVLTRAQGENDALAARLGDAGIEVLVSPLLEIEPIMHADARQRVMDLDRFDHIVFVSRNAVRHGLALLEAYWPQWPVRLDWYAVGAATAATLSAFGVSAHAPEDPSTEGLLASGWFDEMDGQRVLIVRGEGGRELLADTLRERGARVDYLEVYRRRSLPLDNATRQRLVTGAAIVVLYSAETVSALAQSLDGAGKTLSIVVPSGRVGDVARELGFADISIAASAAEDDMAAAVHQRIAGL